MRVPFEYAVVRIVARIDRGESINGGVLVYCRDRDFLGARVDLDVDRLRALDPAADADRIQAALQAIVACCATDATDRSDIGSRFRWLTAPRSTVVQPGPVHTGLTEDPEQELEKLLRLLVQPLPAADS